jgi:hypothetical protein
MFSIISTPFKKKKRKGEKWGWDKEPTKELSL